jgi:anti-sigma factor RsiW
MTMNCKQIQTLVAAYADGEIDALRRYSIKKHLLDCAGCAARHESILALRARIRAEVPYFVASPALHARVRAAVGALRASVPPQPRPTGDRWRWLTGGVLAGCAASVFAWMLGTTVLAWRANEDFAVAAVAAHVRATLGDHLIEVASSDQHTVKPWLSARLDYSPPVQDLTNEGFTLIGGRLDYLERRPVATLVYLYRKHTIDVFVRPEGSRAPTSALRTVRGFNAARASGPSMDWLAVSDAEPAVLSAFVQRLAREDGSR